MLKITYSERFQKHYKKLSADEKTQIRKKLDVFADNPLHPSLRTKRIKGTDGLFEFSVNMDIRVVWFYEGDSLVAFVDIGHHDILKKFRRTTLRKRCFFCVNVVLPVLYSESRAEIITPNKNRRRFQHEENFCGFDCCSNGLWLGIR